MAVPKKEFPIISKPKIVVFSGPAATISNSPPLVTSNKARLAGERILPGRFEHLVPQTLYEPVTVKIKKFSAHPLEEDAAEVYHNNGKDYYEVTLKPEDGPYPLPYMARRKDGSVKGVPFEASDLFDAALNYGGRQGFYPDASRIFMDIDRTIPGRTPNGEGSVLDRKAEYVFVRVLPPGGYKKKGEVSGIDYFPYSFTPTAKTTRYSDLARVANKVQTTLDAGGYEGAIWLEGTVSTEETLYWLSLLIDTDAPIVGSASQGPHGVLGNDGDKNIVDSVDYILSGRGRQLGAVAILDQVIYAAREVQKGDDRPGGFKATGGHGGILGSVKGGNVTIWYGPKYKHTSSSDVNLSRLPESVQFIEKSGDTSMTSIKIKNPDGTLKGETIPRVHIFKNGFYSQKDETENPDQEVDVFAKIDQAIAEQKSPDEREPKLHGFVFEGTTPYARGAKSVLKALDIGAYSGIPVVRVARGDPSGRVATNWEDLTIEGSNLTATKARLLLAASMLKLGRLPKANDPRHPTAAERHAVVEKIRAFQEIFETH